MFDSAGRLTSLRNLLDPTGYSITVTYAANQMVVSEPAPSSRSLTFSLNASGKITSVADSTGRSMSFTVDGPSGNLTGVTGLDLGSGVSTWSFGYEAATHRLTTNGNRMRGPPRPQSRRMCMTLRGGSPPRRIN